MGKNSQASRKHSGEMGVWIVTEPGRKNVNVSHRPRTLGAHAWTTSAEVLLKEGIVLPQRMPLSKDMGQGGDQQGSAKKGRLQF